jgi:hypothetical protein
VNFNNFSDRLVDEQLKFPVIFPVSREFATGLGENDVVRTSELARKHDGLKGPAV